MLERAQDLVRGILDDSDRVKNTVEQSFRRATCLCMDLRKRHSPPSLGTCRVEFLFGSQNLCISVSFTHFWKYGTEEHTIAIILFGYTKCIFDKME